MSTRHSETLEMVTGLALLWLIPVVAFIVALFLG
jgi:paraquat-inducible protein B